MTVTGWDTSSTAICRWCYLSRLQPSSKSHTSHSMAGLMLV